MVADGEVGVLVRVGEVVAAVGVVDADDRRHEQCVDEAVGDAGGVGRRVVVGGHGGGESVLLAASVGGADAELQSRQQFPLQVGVEVVTLEVGVEHDAVLVGVVGREGIAALVGGTGDAQLVLLLDAMAQHGILPVGALAQGGDLLVGVAALVVPVRLLVLRPLRGVHEVELLRDGAHAETVAVGDVGLLSASSFLGSDDDHAVGAAAAVDGCGRHVFEYLHTLNVLWVDARQRVERAADGSQSGVAVLVVLEVDESVDDIQRFVAGVDRVAASDAYAAGVAGLSTGRRDVESCHHAAQGTFDGGLLCVFQGVGLHGRHAAREAVALLSAVADDHHLVEQVALLAELDVDGLLGVVHLHLQRLVADVGNAERQRCVLGCGVGEAAVGIGHDTFTLGSPDDDGGTDEGLARYVVGDAAGEGVLCHGPEGKHRCGCG